MSEKPRWNSNLHAFRQVLPRVPAGAARGLDVGCGEGETTRMLRRHVEGVVGIDPDEASIVDARAYGDDIEYLVTDLASAALEPASFDVVSAVTMLHHLDHEEGLRRMAALVRTGGTLLVVGVAQRGSVRDLACDVLDAALIRRYTFTRGVWETPAPKIWPPGISYPEVRALAERVLPGVEYRRTPFFRYSLVWTKP